MPSASVTSPQPQKVIAMQRALQTATFANLINYKPSSIRTAVWRHGHFNGIQPIKLPNGRLLWPADQIDKLISSNRFKAAMSCAQT